MIVEMLPIVLVVVMLHFIPRPGSEVVRRLRVMVMLLLELALHRGGVVDVAPVWEVVEVLQLRRGWGLGRAGRAGRR